MLVKLFGRYGCGYLYSKHEHNKLIFKIILLKGQNWVNIGVGTIFMSYLYSYYLVSYFLLLFGQIPKIRRISSIFW